MPVLSVYQRRMSPPQVIPSSDTSATAAQGTMMATVNRFDHRGALLTIHGSGKVTQLSN